ncbi:hypothetical protein ABZ464_28725 [Streptomyces sp. NPDC005820]|uniref:hypothetical protein n=1 Tax=Streptomyces sp. NPDC005820 TaxID=3157069 RepID=UPI0033F7A15B
MQETVLAIEIGPEGFGWALRPACPSRHVPELHGDHVDRKRQLRRASPYPVVEDVLAYLRR